MTGYGGMKRSLPNFLCKSRTSLQDLPDYWVQSGGFLGETLQSCIENFTITPVCKESEAINCNLVVSNEH